MSKDVISRIESILVSKGLKKADFARSLGVGTQHYNNWRHQGFPSARLVAAADVLDVNLDWLAKGNGPISQEHMVVGQRIAEARKQNGWSQGELAKKLEEQGGESMIKVAGIKSIEDGRRVDIAPDLGVYAQILGVEEGWLNQSEAGKTIDLANITLHKKEDEVVIPHLSATGSMGKGIPADLEHDTVVSQVSVNKLWIRENLSTISSPSNLSMITGYGDSMEGTFNNGDVLFVDTGMNEIKMDAVYVLNLNDELYIKRLQRKPDGSILMISDNAKYQPYTIQNGEKNKFQVLGRIVGIWNFKRM